MVLISAVSFQLVIGVICGSFLFNPNGINEECAGKSRYTIMALNQKGTFDVKVRTSPESGWLMLREAA